MEAPRTVDNSSFNEIRTGRRAHRLVTEGGDLRIKRQNVSRSRQMEDWFHFLVSQKKRYLLGIIAFFYLSLIVIAGSINYGARHVCEIKSQTFMESLLFALETVSTIGYGANDIYFGGCWGYLIFLYIQWFCSILLDSVAIGIVFLRLAYPPNRTASILFSPKAIIRWIRDKPCFMFQVCDVRKHQLCEAHVRCYAIRHEVDRYGRKRYFKQRWMRTQHPDDQLGGMLLLALPSVVVHQIDQWSPLANPNSNSGTKALCHSHREPNPPCREADYATGGRECLHGIPPLSNTTFTRESWMSAWRENRMEVVCIVEGVDVSTSCTVQARFSYTASEIVFDSMFAPCVGNSIDGRAIIDLQQFGVVVPVSTNAEVVDDVVSHS